MRFRKSLVALALALAPASPAIAAPLDHAGLVGWWTFDDGGGTTVTDASGNGNHGEELFPEDHLPRWGKGDYAGTLFLSATTNNHVQVPASPSLNSVRQGVTVVVTVNPSSLWQSGDKGSGFIALVQRQWRQEGHPDQYYLGYGKRGQTLFYKWHVGLTADSEVSLYALPEGAAAPKTNGWVQIAGTYDALTGRSALYLDGVELQATAGAGEIRLDFESEARPLIIGAELNGANTRDTVGEFRGHLDEVRLYNRALTPGELAHLSPLVR